MSTALGTHLGTYLGTYLGQDDDAGELAALEFYLARNLYSWIRADYRTLVDYGGGDIRVSAFPDKVALESEGAVAPNARSVDAAHAFAQGTQALQVAATAPSSLFSGREAATFTSAQYYDSTIPVVNWRFLHSGEFQWWCSFTPTNSGVNVIFATTNSSTTPGQQQYTNAGNAVDEVGRAGANLFQTTITGAGAVNTAQFTGVSFLNGGGSPEFVSRRNGAVVTSGDTAATPAAADSAGTLRIGGQPAGTFLASMVFTDLMTVASSSAALRTAVNRYMLLRYGIS